MNTRNGWRDVLNIRKEAEGIILYRFLFIVYLQYFRFCDQEELYNKTNVEHKVNENMPRFYQTQGEQQGKFAFDEMTFECDWSWSVRER